MTDIRTFDVEVMQVIRVTLDASKFDQEFADEFNGSIFDAGEPGEQMLRDHAEHIAQMQARGVIDADRYSGEFIEGYGPSKEMGITAESLAGYTEATVLKDLVA